MAPCDTNCCANLSKVLPWESCHFSQATPSSRLSRRASRSATRSLFVHTKASSFLYRSNRSLTLLWRSSGVMARKSARKPSALVMSSSATPARFAKSIDEASPSSSSRCSTDIALCNCSVAARFSRNSLPLSSRLASLSKPSTPAMLLLSSSMVALCFVITARNLQPEQDTLLNEDKALFSAATLSKSSRNFACDASNASFWACHACFSRRRDSASTRHRSASPSDILRARREAEASSDFSSSSFCSFSSWIRSRCCMSKCSACIFSSCST
mmetsp:Transcript_18310/g.50850  ORF Transcript_18310/g.50850 Transcript_18310/m.50850 type:complete len:271 (+) Transcript_18310:943-1755(+)